VSYLDSPRLHFRGWFQADVSTINNDVTAYDISPSTPPADPGWNPEGTGFFRFLDCSITGGFMHGKQITPQSSDSVTGATVQNANQRAPGKLVDLDPQQQMVSMIFGMQVRIVSPSLKTLMQSEYKPAPFANLWQRQIKGLRSDQKLGAMYQSVLEHVTWPEESDSPLLNALREATEDGRLSIEFSVFGYGRDPKIPRYTMGHVIGTIGPWRAGEPEHFILGRQMIAQGPPFGTPLGLVGTLQAKVAQDGRSITVDFGNSFQIQDADSGFANIGQVLLGVLNTNPDSIQQTVASSGVLIIGEVPYLEPDWFTQTAGVQTFDLSGNAAASKLLPNCPLVILSPSAGAAGTYDVRLQETLDGVFTRADMFVFRIEPGAEQSIDFYATRFGAPLPNADIALSNNGDFLAMLGGTPPDISVPPDGVNIPPVGGAPITITTGSNGHVRFSLKANPKGPAINQNPWPRGYLAGQLYALAYQLAQQPANYTSSPGNFVSILAYSTKYNPQDVSPTWYQDIQPLFAQYGKLYPIMNRYVVDLADYGSVVSHLNILTLAFSLPVGDPNHMPVTRDLGAADRAMILQWLSMKGVDGLPPLGTPPPKPPMTAVAAEPAAPEGLLPLQTAGKTAVITKFERRANARKGDNK
jgi:hypothetical protein